MDDLQQIKKGAPEDLTGGGETIIAAKTRIIGKIAGTESVRIQGHLEGEVKSERSIWILKGGSVKGDIASRKIIIDGKLDGAVTSAEHVEIKADGHVTGNIRTDKITIAEGSFINGEIHMLKKDDRSDRFLKKDR